MTGETYYRGIATDTFTESDTGIILIANDENVAMKRYYECVNRNNRLRAKEPLIIGTLWNAKSLIDEHFSDSMKIELEERKSVAEYLCWNEQK